MQMQRTDAAVTAHAMLAGDRARLVRLCTWLTGDPMAAEDLAQDTLIEAWQQGHVLRDPAAREAWLSTIARRACLRWARRRDRDVARAVWWGHDGARPGATPEDQTDDTFDVEVALERAELARLLDRALALLPSPTRAALVAKYIHGTPQAEIAARLGLSEGAIEARLHRGKLVLRHVLTTELREEAAAHGVGPLATTAWQETRISCTVCGRARLLGHFDQAKPELTLRCPDCYLACGGEYAHTVWAACLTGVAGYKPALSRLVRLATAHFRQALAGGEAPCVACGGRALVRMGRPAHFPPALRALPEAHLCCTVCGSICDQSLHGLALGLPQGQRFLREHPRIRALPAREVEVDGRAAVVTSFESIAGYATLDVLSACDTFEALGVHGTPVG